jgi:hypothetical protein
MDAQKNFSNDFSDHNKMPFVSSFLAEAILFLNENSVTWIHGYVEKETKRKIVKTTWNEWNIQF